MKLLGAAMILFGTMGTFLLWRERSLEPIRVGEALLRDLAVLERCICRRQMSLPAITGAVLRESAAAQRIWTPLHVLMTEGEKEGLSACWQIACGNLPSQLQPILSPLGPLLPEGGQALHRAINETREELTGFLRAQRQRQTEDSRLGGAVSMASACLLILVLI